MEVTVTFKKDQDTYMIKRARGEHYISKIYKNGTTNEHDITPAGMTDIDKKIEEIIGVSYELFTRVIIFNGNAKPFLDLSVNDQRNQIEELFKITTLTKKAIALKEIIRSTEKDIEIQNILIKQQEAQNALHKKHIHDAETRIIKWETDREQKIKVITSQLASVENVDFETEQLLIDERTRLNGVIKEMKQSELKVKQEAKTNNTSIEKLSAELSHLRDAKCPYCLQKYEDAASKIEDISGKINAGNIVAFKHDETLATLGTDLALNAEQLVAISQEIKCADLSSLLAIKSNLNILQSQRDMLIDEVNPHADALEAMINEEEIKIDYDKLDELKKHLEHEKFLLKLLTDKNSFIRKKIISKTIPFLNKQIAGYVEDLGLPHVVKFMPDMSCEISEYNRILDHGNLSNGEQKRLNLGMSLAFRDVLFHLHSQINILFCDEIDAGAMDSNIIDAVVRLLKHKAREDNIGIYIISHRPEIEGRCDRNITVRKENGFSNIIEQDI
jgi:hypothetical protein